MVWPHSLSMEAMMMNPSTLPTTVDVPDFPERLSLTARDRRLESRVLVRLLRQGDGTERRGSSQPSSPRRPEPIDEPDHSGEARIGNHAESLAEFLAGEYGIVAPEQKRALAGLAAEMAQRIEEELPDPYTDPGRCQTSPARGWLRRLGWCACCVAVVAALAGAPPDRAGSILLTAEWLEQSGSAAGEDQAAAGPGPLHLAAQSFERGDFRPA
jgi:hypothetical protein